MGRDAGLSTDGNEEQIRVGLGNSQIALGPGLHRDVARPDASAVRRGRVTYSGNRVP